jgi:hypothetical protein
LFMLIPKTCQRSLYDIASYKSIELALEQSKS